MAMKPKTVTIEGKTYAVLADDGNPIYVHDDGKELPFDAAATVATITRITDESKVFKTRAQTAEQKVEAFKDVDAEAAKKALETVANLDAGKLLTAEKVAEIKEAAIKATKEQYKSVEIERDTVKGERDKIQSDMHGLIRSNAFTGSKFIKDKVAVPPHMLESTFGSRFKIEDGKMVPYDGNGNKMFSRVKPGEVAEFDEAIELTIASDPYKDSILKGAVGGGGGGGNGNGGTPGSKTLTRQQFEAIPVHERAAKMKDHTIVDA